jgi:AraC-like DNA-binding protein
MNATLLSCLGIRISWVIRHEWRPGDAILGLNSPSHRLWRVLDGAVQVRIRDSGEERLLEIPAGEVILLPHGVVRDVRTPRGATWLSIDLMATLPGRVDLLMTLRPPRVWRPSPPTLAAMDSLLTYLEIEAGTADWEGWRPGGVRPAYGPGAPRFWSVPPPQASDPTLNALRESMGIVLFGLCWRSLSGDKDVTDLFRGGDSPPWLGTVLDTIAQTPGIELNELAATIGLTPVQMRRGFHRWLGMSPQEYLLRARLDAACRLLETTDHSIAAIAERVGFESLSYFTRRFKENFGHTPGRHRRFFSEGAIALEGVRTEQKGVS